MGRSCRFPHAENSPPDNEAMNRYRIREGGEAQFEQRWGSADSTIAGCLCWMSYGAVTQDTRKWRHCSTARCGSEAWMDFAGSAFYDECQAHLSRRERSPPAGRKSSSRVSSSIQANHGFVALQSSSARLATTFGSLAMAVKHTFSIFP